MSGTRQPDSETAGVKQSTGVVLAVPKIDGVLLCEAARDRSGPPPERLSLAPDGGLPLPSRRLVRSFMPIPLRKRDAEVKLLLGCTCEEENDILSFLNKGLMAAILVTKHGDSGISGRPVMTPAG